MQVKVDRSQGHDWEFDVHLLVPAASLPQFSKAVQAIADADCLTAGDLLTLPGGARISDFCCNYAAAWWLTGEIMDGPNAYTRFAVALEGENIKFSLNIMRASAGLDYTKTVDPNLWWVDAAAVFKELLTMCKGF